MRLALRAFGVRWIAPALVACAIIGGVLGGRQLPVPSLTGTGAVPVTLVSALAAVILLAWPIDGTRAANRTVSVRHPTAVLLSCLCVATAPALVLSIVIGLSWSEAAGLRFAGIFAWLLALQILTGVLVSSRYQAVAPAGYVLLCALVGRSGSVPHPWAWPLAEVDAAIGLLAGGVALVIAVAALVLLGLHREAD